MTYEQKMEAPNEVWKSVEANTYTSVEMQVEICPGCKGAGQMWEYGYANSVHHYDCRRCGNSGRIRVTTMRVEEPFIGRSPEKDSA